MKIRFLSIPLQISFPFVAFSTCFILMDSSGTAFWGILAAAVHEAGHLLVLFCENTPPKEICIRLFEFVVVDACQTRSYGKEIVLSLAGPIANFLTASVFYMLSGFLSAPLFLTIASVNLLLGLFNLLPVESLDGGKILYSLLALGFGAERAEKAVLLISFFVLLPMAVLGFFILLRSQYNYTLLLLSCYLMAALIFSRKNIKNT